MTPSLDYGNLTLQVDGTPGTSGVTGRWARRGGELAYDVSGGVSYRGAEINGAPAPDFNRSGPPVGAFVVIWRSGWSTRAKVVAIVAHSLPLFLLTLSQAAAPRASG